ncbi:hypothetical protein E3U55_02170 [Filobacillus milosensis]|uniref:Blue (type 1) copper domain-containing protein n=1 Tax=Filobacillus milosensis TaxID=94137 RepID=A0A4Y8IVJ0_9BACI|nr:plastocyanin/azurin family copper-binding protein [Filobacillus milosensis]TFB24328.1 hypothetical protein E3U55_02170 [Filobacillus milosensis]
MINIKKMLYSLGISLVIVGLLVGCNSDEGANVKEDNQTKTEETKQEESENTEQGNEKADTEQETADNVIEISAFEMGYTPPSVSLEKGKEYTLILKNNGELFHDLTAKDFDVEITYMGEMPDHPDETSFIDVIDKLLGTKKVYADEGHGHKDEKMKFIHMNAKAGQTVEIKFIPKETGKFDFICTVPGHKEAGMHGEMEVK